MVIAEAKPQHAQVMEIKQAVKGEVETKIRETFAPLGQGEVENAIKVANCESGLRSNAHNRANTNGTEDVGVFQINTVHFKKYGRENLFNPDVNIQAAYDIRTGWGNWSAWVCARNLGIR